MSKPVLPFDIAFLTNSGFSSSALSQIVAEAAELAVYPHVHMLANGRIAENAYYEALADAHGLSFAARPDDFEIVQSTRDEEIGIACRAGLVRARHQDRMLYLYAPYGRDLASLLARVKASPALREHFIITTQTELRRLLLEKNSAPVLAHALNRLHAVRPADSARRSYRPFFGVLAVVILAITLSVLYRAPLFAPLVGAVCAALYLLACYFRILAYGDFYLWHIKRPPPLADGRLPACSVLAPIYNEARLVPQLVAAIRKIDYPRAKLDVLFLVEQNDAATRNALGFASLPPFCRVIAVPEGQPRTKPRALQVGLSFARGDMVTIFDAEDIPHPLQLRHAAQQLHAGGPGLACVQAQLRIDNEKSSWLARQFAFEYAALFNVFLPSLARRGYPILLGGTSNYFRVRALRQVGGWDPWNVTEDADLGVRLARAGYHAGTCETPTEEEAPVTLRNWLRQRMRWQKGWMQTLVVHFSQFHALRKDLGVRNLLGLIATLCVSLLSAFAYPVTMLWVLLDAVIGLKGYGINVLGATVFGASIAAFIGGNLLPILHLHAGGRRAGFRFDLFSLATVWAYWLLISISAYGALYDLAKSPYHWFKTEHLGRGRKLQNIFGLPWIFSGARHAPGEAANDMRPATRFSALKQAS